MQIMDRVKRQFPSHVEFGTIVDIDDNGGMWVRWDSLDAAEPSGPYVEGEIEYA